MHGKRRVVVTGLGLVTPLGLTLEENWQKALLGVSGITGLKLPNSERSPIQAVGAVGESDWAKITAEFAEEASREGERRTLFGLWAARSALRDAKITDNGSDGNRFGVFFAAGLGITRLEDIQRWISADGKFDFSRFNREYHHVHEESVIRCRSDRPAALIARKFGLRGVNVTVTAACASATQAIGMGFKAIQRGEADLILAGGSDSMIHPIGLIFFALLGAAATAPRHTSNLPRPFDRRRSGLVIGEGAGVVILEEETRARRRGASIYAEVMGYASSLDAYQVTAPHPRGEGAAQSMRLALQDAHLEPGEIDYINAHGTGTKLNDIAETLAIKKVFTEHAYRIPVSSSKSLIGHLMAAAGGPEFIFTALSVQGDIIHPTINLTSPDPKCDLDYVPQMKRLHTVKAALSNSFGFGGQNASIVIKKPDF